MTRFGRLRTTLATSGYTDGILVNKPSKNLLDVIDDNGAVVGTVELEDLLADMNDRLAALEAPAKVKPGDTREVEKPKAPIRPVIEARKKGTEKSAKVRKQNQEDWIAYAKARIRDMRERDSTLTRREAVDRLTDKNEPWPPSVRRPGRSTLEKAMPTLWVEGQVTWQKQKEPAS
jgi:hypothetical protein